ncbi:hypothetical protein L0156_30940 [bacterium]|nr:hypothetical protein [bacterium]
MFGSKKEVPLILVGLLLYPCGLFGKGTYVEYSTFRQWVNLVSEVESLEVCGLTAAAHSLWAVKQLRVPRTTFLQFDFSGTGRKDWIVQLHQAKSSRPCDYVLIVDKDKGKWIRAFFREIRPDKAERWTLLWNSHRRAIGIDIGKHRRRTAPAEMSWSEGKRWSKPGFVVEDAFIDSWIEWNKEKQHYEYKSSSGEWWEIEQ